MVTPGDAASGSELFQWADDASAFSDVTPGWVHEAEGRRGRRVRKSRQKEAAGAADAGLMQIEWSERGV